MNKNNNNNNQRRDNQENKKRNNFNNDQLGEKHDRILRGCKPEQHPAQKKTTREQ